MTYRAQSRVIHLFPTEVLTELHSGISEKEAEVGGKKLQVSLCKSAPCTVPYSVLNQSRAQQCKERLGGGGGGGGGGGR